MQARHLIFSLLVHPGSAKKQRWPAMTLWAKPKRLLHRSARGATSGADPPRKISQVSVPERCFGPAHQACPWKLKHAFTYEILQEISVNVHGFEHAACPSRLCNFNIPGPFQLTAPKPASQTWKSLRTGEIQPVGLANQLEWRTPCCSTTLLDTAWHVMPNVVQSCYCSICSILATPCVILWTHDHDDHDDHEHDFFDAFQKVTCRIACVILCRR